ncbi:MmgE/PrpD family protein [Burkholderia sp. 22PA0106]|uniref:MmgE/PrpD family protein n=1 Tax=Burkholderia sp. 22PA0106 TaxID=3237371 RepID=UPI0039C228DC
MSEPSLLRRHRFLQSAGALAALSCGSARAVLAAAGDAAAPAGADGHITAQLARYMAQARDMPLPGPVVLACKHRILDTFGAMVSGSRMRPGMLAAKYVGSLGGAAQASVIGTRIQTSIVNAALANAMCAHSDETDDFEPVTKENPLSGEAVAAKARDLMQPVLGAARTAALIDKIEHLETLADLRELGPLISA